MGHTVRFNYLDGRSFVENIQLLREVYVYPPQWGQLFQDYSQSTKPTQFRLRIFQYASRHNPKEADHDVPKWATWERDELSFEPLWVARWYEYFEMIDGNRETGI